MKFTPLFFAASLLALVPHSAHAKIERVVEKSFRVQPGGSLRVETQGGNVRVETSDEPTVKVVARQIIKADSERKADEILEKHQLVIEQSGDGVPRRLNTKRSRSAFGGVHGHPFR